MWLDYFNMVKKEVYLRFGSRNKCITFVSRSGISDWNNLREVMRQTAEKDDDLKRRLLNCSVIFQKYKVKKSTGEKILVDVNEDEEPEVEHDADLAVVFCRLEDISQSQAPENKTESQNVVTMESPTSLFFDLSSDVLKCHKILNEIENDVNIKNANDDIVGTYEVGSPEKNIAEKNEESVNLQMTGTITMKPTESLLKRKLDTKSKPEKTVKKPKGLPFHVPNILPHSLCEYAKHPNGIIRHSSEFIRHYAGMLRTQLNNQITKEHYKEMAKIIAERHPILADEGEDVPYNSIRKSLSECVRNLRAREKRKIKQFVKEGNSSSNEEESNSSVPNLKMASIHPVDTESYSQETDKEKKKQEVMMEELKTLTENVGLTSHVKALLKETFIKRKDIIDMSDTISTVLSNFPFLLKAEMILFEFSLRVNLKLSDIFDKIDALIVELGSFLKIPDDTISENKKLTILQKIYSEYKPKRTAKNVQPLFTVKEASSPPGEELITKETEGPRLVIYVENNAPVAAFVVADGRRIKINKLSVIDCLMVLLGTYHAWASDFPGPYVSSLSIFDYFALETPNNYSCKIFDDFKRDFRRWRAIMCNQNACPNTQPTHN